MLKTILSSRAKGITQADLTKVLGLDPRSAGQYVKVLTQKGYMSVFTKAEIVFIMCMLASFLSGL